MSKLSLKDLFLLPFLGGDFKGGYLSEGDIVTTTIDGIDVNALWAEFQATLQIYNQKRAQLIQLLTYPVTNLVETVPQVGDATFEEASEFGVPKSSRVTVDYFQLGYDFRWYDVANRYTWKFLADADARQIQAVHDKIMEADQKLVFRKVMEAVFDNRNRTTDIRTQTYNVYPLYNNDGTTPPSYKGTTFLNTHSHYLVSGAATIDSGDIEDMYEHIAEHGFSIENNTTVALMVNRAEAKEIRKFKAGSVNNNGVTANYDFIPAMGQPAMIIPNADGLLGQRPPGEYRGFKVIGSYADILIIEESYIPAGYLFMFGSGGSGNLNNLVGLREHANPGMRGLRLLAGNQQAYPLSESFYSRGFGTGVRQRGGGVIMQLTTNGSYTPPSAYTRGTSLV